MKRDKKQILVIDDEVKITEVVKSYLENSGFEVHTAFNCTDALMVFNTQHPDLMILDLMLPDMSGEAFCQLIRKQSRIPIIMLTAKVEEISILKGLEIGADDYVTKPFSPRQLVARVQALLRRSAEELVPLSNTMSFNGDDLTIDVLGREVYKAKSLVNLTPIEYKLLMVLIKYPNKVFTRDELITYALGDDYVGYDRTIDSHIKNLRSKIETDTKVPKYVVTVHGVGYRFGGE